MTTIFLKFISKNKLNKYLFFSFFSVFFFSLLLGLSRLSINQDITASLPKGEQFKDLNQFLQSSKINNQLAFSLQIEHLDADEIEDLAQNLSDSLNYIGAGFFEKVSYYSNTDESDFYQYFYQRLPLYLEQEQIDSLALKTNTEAIAKSIANNYKKLISPEGTFLKDFILKDPLSITPLALQNMSSDAAANYSVEDGITFSKDKKNLYIFSTLLDSLQSNTKAQSILAKKLAIFKKEWNRTNSDNSIEYFSPFLIAVANADQIKKDTQLTLGIFVSFALLLLFWYYKKLSTPFYFLMPAVFGILFSLACIAWFKASISAISIGAGAIVLGIILDYAFHFFTHYKHSKSLDLTVKEIAFPLLTGSFTTIIAFLALQFTNSVILQDFGLFAALSLLGAVFFTIVVLPVILHVFSFEFPKEVKSTDSKFKFTVPFKVNNKYIFAFVLALTLFFLYHSQYISFDTDLEHLGYHPEELKQAEKSIFNLNPNAEKKIFLFTEAKDFNEASLLNYKLYKQLKNMKYAQQITSAAAFYIPQSVQQKRIDTWNLFWSKNKERVFADIRQEAEINGFSENAFETFFDWINTDVRLVENISSNFFKDIGVEKLVDLSGEKPVFITTLVVAKEHKRELLEKIQKNENVAVLDRSSMVEDMLELVQKDFNFILLISSLIVFITLLVVYGRIELALIVFIPMMVSWIWILGLASLLNIQFNFVNIIITTFIFGLGDDFSIFISDGVLSKYKYGKNLFGTYKTAIYLSALTTIVGTGVLIFAQHPAVYSIGFISVLGMLCILIVSFSLQPLLYDWLILDRIKKARSPWTLTSWLLSAFAYSYFLVGCILASIIATLFLLIPMSKKKKRKGMATILHYFGASLIYIMFNVTKRFFNREILDLSKPSILIANHSSVLDILLTLTISPKVLLVTNNWVYNSPFFGYLVRTAGFILNEDIDKNLDSIKEKIEDGYSIMIFPEGTRSKTGKMGRFKKGAFYLSEKLELDITPVLIHGAHYTMSKSDFQLKNSWLNVSFLPRIKHDDLSFGTGYRARSKEISKFYKTKHRSFSLEMEDTQFLKEPLLYNYIYKGPVLEWYFRVKYQLEAKNYAFYDQNIFDLEQQKQSKAASILDLGCGYGFLDYYLLFRNDERKIIGLDYDENKIAVAQNNYKKTKYIDFATSDLRSLIIEERYDVVFIMDVLHYFSHKKQKEVIQNCINSLNDNGIIFIRDGVKDYKEKHRQTMLSELMSSRLGFNKKEEEFAFFDLEFIHNIANENQLEIELIKHSDKTSNVLFILRKKNT